MSKEVFRTVGLETISTSLAWRLKQKFLLLIVREPVGEIRGDGLVFKGIVQ
jgi:hypothetical protein